MWNPKYFHVNTTKIAGRTRLSSPSQACALTPGMRVIIAFMNPLSGSAL
jgi:hypothetical protein